MDITHDADFESGLLSIIDRYLASRGGFETFLRFKDTFCAYFAEQTVETDLDRLSLEEFERLSKDVQDAALAPVEAQLPWARREAFSKIAELAWYTMPERPTDDERGWGYITLAEFVEILRIKRGEYRNRYGV